MGRGYLECRADGVCRAGKQGENQDGGMNGKPSLKYDTVE